MLVADWMNALNVFTVATLYMEMTLCFVLNAISITFMIYFRMFSPINMLVINLAIADILYSSCVPYYVRQFDDMMIPQTKFGCRMSFILDVTCMIVNVFTVSALTIERYTSIRDKTINPNDSCRKRIIFIFIILLWLFAIGFSMSKALSIVEREVKLNNNETMIVCDSTYSERAEAIYTILKWILAFLLPYSVIIFFSCCLLKFLKEWSNRTKHLQAANNKNNKNKRPVAPIESNHHSNGGTPLNNQLQERLLPGSLTPIMKKVTIHDTLVQVVSDKDGLKPKTNGVTTRLADNFSALSVSRKSSAMVDEDRSSYEIAGTSIVSPSTTISYFKQTSSTIDSDNLRSNNNIHLDLVSNSLVSSDPISSSSPPTNSKSKRICMSGSNARGGGPVSSAFITAASAAKKGSRQSQIKKRTTRFVLALVISFLCAWSPLWIFQIVVTFTDSHSHYLQIARNLTLIGVYMEGVTNPLLFLILTETFREFFFNKVCFFLKKK